MDIYSGFSHQTWWFSIVMLVYQRVYCDLGDIGYYHIPFEGFRCRDVPISIGHSHKVVAALRWSLTWSLYQNLLGYQKWWRRLAVSEEHLVAAFGAAKAAGLCSSGDLANDIRHTLRGTGTFRELRGWDLRVIAQFQHDNYCRCVRLVFTQILPFLQLCIPAQSYAHQVVHIRERTIETSQHPQITSFQVGESFEFSQISQINPRYFQRFLPVFGYWYVEIGNLPKYPVSVFYKRTFLFMFPKYSKDQ